MNEVGASHEAGIEIKRDYPRPLGDLEKSLNNSVAAGALHFAFIIPMTVRLAGMKLADFLRQ